MPDLLGNITAVSVPCTVMLPPSVPPRPAVRPWSKDLSLYEEYKMQRSELRRRNILRRRELEKSLPQPLLADLVSPPQTLSFLHIHMSCGVLL